MADDHSQRFFRNDAAARGSQGRGDSSSSANDPLAELARLIGQNDPFGEYARDQQRPQAAPERAAPATATLQWDFDRPTATYAERDPLAEAHAETSAYADPHGEAGHDADYYAAAPEGHEQYAHEQYPYDPNNPQYAHEEQDFYDDVPPSRRRTGILVIAGIFALAVIGTAGAFGYRAIFGAPGASGPPPVIKADTTPSKIVPAGPASDASNKLITDRVNDPAQGERLVSREEKPVEINDGQAAMGPTTGQVDGQPGAAPAPIGTGVVATEPKKVRTIAIHPDGTMVAEATPPAEAAQPPAEPVAPPLATTPEPAEPAVAPPVPAPQQPARAARPQTIPEHAAARPAPARPAPAAPVAHRAVAASNAPLSLNPNAPTPHRAAAPTRTASAAPTPLAAPAPRAARTGGYAVQVSSQRSEAEAQAAFRGLQGKFPNQLGGRPLMIHRVDLGSRGVYYRAMVGPFANAAAASQLCSSLKAAGGQCIVQKN